MIWLKLKLRDKNRFLIRAFKEKITLYEIKEEKDVCYVKIDRQDKEKIKKMWFVKILDEKKYRSFKSKRKDISKSYFSFFFFNRTYFVIFAFSCHGFSECYS